MGEQTSVKVERTETALHFIVPTAADGNIADIAHVAEIAAWVTALAPIDWERLASERVAEALQTGVGLWRCMGARFVNIFENIQDVSDPSELQILIFYCDGCMTEVELWPTEELARDAYWQYWGDSHDIAYGDEAAVEAIQGEGRNHAEWTSASVSREVSQ